MSNEIQVLKNDEKQQLIPSAWRKTLREIVEAFKEGDFHLNRDIAGVRKLPSGDAERIANNIKGYGARLASLPDDTWETSACQWMRGYWDALIDLYTVEEGPSDLTLSVRVYEAGEGYDFQIESVHVP